MKFGIAMFATHYSMAPADLCVEAEARGFESYWAPEHSHIPSSRQSPWPGGGELPMPYYEVLDPFVALASAASLTKTIKLCTGICLVIQRDPIQLAKETASLDHLSGGRFIMGVGGGWNAEEMGDHGTDFKTRFKLMAERIAAIRTIWTQEEAEFHGDYVDFDKMKSWPKPVQAGGPPIIVGGAFPYGAKRAIAFGDGWMPVGGRDVDFVDLIPRFRQMAAEAGREPDELPVGIFGVQVDGDAIARCRDAGVDRVVFMLPSADADEILPQLDNIARLM